MYISGMSMGAIDRHFATVTLQWVGFYGEWGVEIRGV